MTDQSASPVETLPPTGELPLGAEALGTFWLAFGGCGTAIFAGDQVGNLGVAFASGLAMLSGAYALGYPVRP